MERLTPVRRISLCAMCIALCYVLPIAFHPLGLGNALSPMHIPVFLCGLVCGAGPGLICGLIGPVLSSMLTGMPAAPMLMRMIPELMTYGVFSGLGMQAIRLGSTGKDVYLSLALAMVLGRIAAGIATAVFFMVTSGVYSFGIWFTGYFIEKLPGMILHFLLVPIAVISLEKARLIPVRYPKDSVM